MTIEGTYNGSGNLSLIVQVQHEKRQFIHFNPNRTGSDRVAIVQKTIFSTKVRINIANLIK